MVILGVLWSLIWLALTVLLIVAQWRIFSKAGQPGWASLIPIYNMVKWLQITGRSGWWVLAFCVPLLNIFVAIRLVFNLAAAFGRGVGFGFGLLLLSPIFLCILAFGHSHYVGRGAAA